ncbi:transposase [Vairimorpha ceranae]|uniref:Transposase n=1 Tax=Vairimorpha ceranae TaxID=40302 RepID=A0A0F9WAI5_9MICR|nr:transposase [Vairimorpha ceranae]KKO73940.1 transposase [Vairimorpha ceranae]
MAGPIMVWICFSYYGVKKLIFIEKKINVIKYIRIPTDDLDASAETMGLPEYNFQQGNDPKRTANMIKQWFAAKAVELYHGLLNPLI